VEYEKGKLTSKEALANIGEMITSDKSEKEVEHFVDLANKILDKEFPFDEFSDTDSLEDLFGSDED
jgi:hypothetical protein